MPSSRMSSSLNTLRQFGQQKDSQGAEVKVCELCSQQISPEHRHLLHMNSREVTCVCDPCAMRFHDVVGGRYKLIPRDVYALPDLQIDDAQWDRLSLPINLAFFFYQTSREDEEDGEEPSGEEPSEEEEAEVAALYPSPAGATESLLSLEAWETLADRHPVLEEMEPDVQALLVNRVDETEAYYLAPIDTCYRLVGLIRLHWRGFSGGQEVWSEIDDYFDALDRNSRTWTSTHA